VATSCTSPPTRLAQISDLVDERDLHGEEGVGSIFGELRRFPAHKHDRRIAQRERLIKPLHNLPPSSAVAADQHPIGMSEVADGGAFAQKLRIGANHHIHIRTLGAAPPMR
jgi:hypothetical protein